MARPSYYKRCRISQSKSQQAKAKYECGNLPDVSIDRDVVIRVANLRKHFGETRAVDGTEFEVERGTIFALLGANGAGKTTTVSMLEGLLKRDGGKIDILGLDPWSDHNRLKLKIGVMPQDFTFFEKITPSDSLRFYRDLFNADIDYEKLLKLVILESSADIPFEELSGGQKQKLGLALSLVNDPELLFLDEPTTGLDPSSRRAVWNIIKGFREQGKTVVLTTHYMEEAEQLADRVAIMNHGRIVIQGTLEEILSDHGSGRRLVLTSGNDMAQYLRSKSIEVAQDGKNLIMKVDGELSLVRLVEIIEDSGIHYTQLSVRSGTLEDVFIRLVGEMAEGELK